MYDYDMDGRSLARLHPGETYFTQGGYYCLPDSIYIEYLQHDYRCRCASGDGKLPEYHLSVTLSPLHAERSTASFLEYKFSAFSLTDREIPSKPVHAVADTKGEVNLTFLVGKADLDDKNPQNQVELNRLNQELRAIETNPDASLKSFHITGWLRRIRVLATNLRLANCVRIKPWNVYWHNWTRNT